MPGRARGRSDTIPHGDELLVALGTCRKTLIDASTEVRPFGSAYHAISMVTRSIDALATYITGERDHFSIGGSTGQHRAER